MAEETDLTVGQVAQVYDVAPRKIRKVVDALDTDLPRAGQYRLIPRAVLTKIAVELERRGYRAGTPTPAGWRIDFRRACNKEAGRPDRRAVYPVLAEPVTMTVLQTDSAANSIGEQPPLFDTSELPRRERAGRTTRRCVNARPPQTAAVNDPELFCRTLDRDAAGPGGARARRGALQIDLRLLREATPRSVSRSAGGKAKLAQVTLRSDSAGPPHAPASRFRTGPAASIEPNTICRIRLECRHKICYQMVHAPAVLLKTAIGPEGRRACSAEPAMRTKIQSLSTTAGYLEGAPVTFAEGLTCIIGARGTCKSTIVETIRFVFDCDPKRVQLLLDDEAAHDAPSAKGLIRATLGQGTARCTIRQVGSDGPSGVTIERDVDSGPRVYRDDIKEISDRSVLDCIEIYSQGDLQAIAEKDELRLELIDRPNKALIARLMQQRARAADRLRELGQRLRAQRGNVEALRAKVQGLDALRVHLSELHAQRPTLSHELDSEREAFLSRKVALERLQAALTAREEAIVALLNAVGSGLDLGMADELRRLAAPEADTLLAELESFAELLLRIRREAGAAQSADLAPLFIAVQQRAEECNATYFRLRQEQQDVNDALKREDSLKQQIVQLEKLECELEQSRTAEQELLQERAECRRAMREASDRIFRSRIQQVDQINSDHSDVVVLTLTQSSRRSEYAKRLTELLQGSRLRNQEDVARDLAEKVRPSDLIDIVEAGDAQRLADLIGRDLGQMARLVAFLMDSSDFYDLEGVVFEDRLEITMYDGDVPKPVSQLSRGQMATALLPLILRSADYPLIFDQPEDDLDNRFIYTELVERIRTLKRERQLIFVTHNANIPVLGEADAIIVMQMEHPERARPPAVGTVDSVKQHILTLLEGGADAFRRRHDRYGDLLT